MERWKVRVDNKQRRRKKRYWMTMGWLARAPKLLMSVVVDGGLAFSILAHVRYTSNKRSSMPRRMTDRSNLSDGAMRELWRRWR